MTADLVAALRETPTVSPHLHVPLQSGDDEVLRAMGRRYTVAQYLAKLEPLRDFNLTADVIVGFPAEDEAAFERTLDIVARAGLTKIHVFPYSPRPGTRTAAEDSVPPAVKAERSARLRALSDELCRRRWQSKVGSIGLRARRPPGSGLRRRLHALARRRAGGRARARPRDGCRRRWGARRCRLRPADCLFCRLVREGDHVHAADGFVAIRDIDPKAETHLLVLPERHVDTFRDIAEFPPDEAKRMLEFVAETAIRAGLEDYRVIVNVGPGGGQTVFHLHWHVLGGASLPGFA